jgi:signal transduction histidine kinase
MNEREREPERRSERETERRHEREREHKRERFLDQSERELERERRREHEQERKHEHKRHERERTDEHGGTRAHGPLETALRAVFVIGLLVAALALGYGVTYLLFQLTGRPPAPAAYLISAVLGLALTASAIGIIGHIVNPSWGSHDPKEQGNMILRALDRIAQGDFDIFIQEDTIGPYTDLAQSVNKMARELGTMENLRQEFISNVSHEIQSPLTSIGGFAELLQQGELTDRERDHYLAIIQTESTRLSRLSENLLKLSALDGEAPALSKTDFRLDRQIESVALMLEPQWAEKSIILNFALVPLTLHADEELLKQVWINLLHNAIKFTPVQGTIHIELQQTEHGARCSVEDSGIGIPPTALPHIFERFYKADTARERSLGGNGLGLSLVKRIIELHEGSITVKSEAGLSTCFTVQLP